MFFKIGVLKKFAAFTGKHLCWPLQAFFYRTPTVAAYRFSRQQILFSAESGIYCWQSICFCPKLLWKHELNVRSSHRNSSVKKGVFRNFASFTGRQLCWSLFLIELQTFRPANFIEKRLQHRWFPVGFTKCLRTSNLKSANDCFSNLFFHQDCPFNNLRFRLKLGHICFSLWFL